MKNNSIIKILCMVPILSTMFITSCNKKSETTITPPELENIKEASSIDSAITNMYHYHDSCVTAKSHASSHLQRYDSIYHYNDSLYIHHHTNYHHGDTLHHHGGLLHGTNQHTSHDSLNNTHHHAIH